MSDDAKDEAEEEDWRLARHFKLHLHPAELRTSHNVVTEGKTSSRRDLGYGLVSTSRIIKRSRLE
jgi:hypothetical protein